MADCGLLAGDLYPFEQGPLLPAIGRLERIGCYRFEQGPLLPATGGLERIGAFALTGRGLVSPA